MYKALTSPKLPESQRQIDRLSDRQTQVQQQQPPQTPPSKEIHKSSVTNDVDKITWPFFKPDYLQPNEKFWIKKGLQPNPKGNIQFQGSLLRIGKKKKTPKAYYYILTNDGFLQYYKKGEQKSKGYIQITGSMVAHIQDQRINKDNFLGVRIEKQAGLCLSFFDQKSQMTLEFFSCLKDHCMVSGFERLYIQMEMLGKGSFASVYKVKSIHSDNLFAAKTYFKETFENNQHKDKFVLMITNEIKALRKVIHPGIIRLYEVIQEKDRLILIMELVNGSDLYVLLKEKKFISEKNAAYMLKGIAEALNELHNNDFVHRDLKLENIMLRQKDSWDTQLVDFGFAEPINNKELVSKAGTPGYIPPEIFKLNPYTSKGDVFSIGVIFYSLISGISAFKGRNYQAILDENRKCEISFERSVWKPISYECKSLIKKMLSPKPQNRLSCAEILENEWIMEHTSSEQKISKQTSQMTKQKSIYNPSDGSENDFAIEFSRKTNDLKSFYHRMNSQKTFKTQKSSVSIHSNNANGMLQQNKAQRSSSATRQQQFSSAKSQTMKASVHTKHLIEHNERTNSQEEISQGKKKLKQSIGYTSDQASFGEVIHQDSIEEGSRNTMKMFDDTSIPLTNLTFLKTSSSAFNKLKNKRKKPA